MSVLGYNNKLAWIDLDSKNVEYSELNEDDVLKYLGGRGLGVAILYDRCKGIEPLSSKSILCVVTGPLTSSGFPLANRLTFVFRSPLTGTIAWTNTGGYAGAELKNAGIDGLVIKGVSDKPVYLLVNDGKVSICDASELWGLRNIATLSKLRQNHGDARILSIGPAGERLVRFATVVNDSGRASGVRHGVGCVMGSKKLKAIVIKGKQTPSYPMVKKSELVQLVKRLVQKLRDSKLLNRENGILAVYGTPVAVEALGANEAIPFMNYRTTLIDRYELVGGLNMSKTILHSRLTCYNCPVSCRRETFSGERYGFRVEGPDYAQISSLGTNCNVLDLEAIAYMNYICYDLGIDPIEMGNTLAMFAELSELKRYSNEFTLKWGDVNAMIALIEKTAFRADIGSELYLGAEGAAKSLGHPELSMSVKGITIQNTDPRVEPAWGLLNATESFGGAVHIWVYGRLIYSMHNVGVDVLLKPESSHEEVAKAVADMQDRVALLDSLQVCAFSSYVFSLKEYAEALRYVTGLDLDAEELRSIGRRIFTLERSYNLENGFTPSSDTLPSRFLNEPLPDGRNRGKTCELEPLLKEYYRYRRWGGGYVSKLH